MAREARVNVEIVKNDASKLQEGVWTVVGHPDSASDSDVQLSGVSSVRKASEWIGTSRWLSREASGRPDRICPVLPRFLPCILPYLVLNINSLFHHLGL